MKDRFDTLLSVVLASAIIAGAAIIVVARFDIFGDDDGITPGPPTYVNGWSAMLLDGMQAGNPNAPIQLIEFVDLECPACRAFNATLKKLKEEFGEELAVTYMHLPAPYHRHAGIAARAALCAHEQGRGSQLIDVVFDRSDSLGVRPWSWFSEAAGVIDQSRFDRCLAKVPPDPGIANVSELADSIAITGTPTILINGWRFQSGAPPLKFLREFIESARTGQLHPGSSLVPLAPRLGRDSSGTILRHTSFDLEAAPTLELAPAPFLIIGHPDDPPEFDLTGLGAVASLSDGALVVAAGSPARLLVFDSHGAPERVLATFGEGPSDIGFVAGIAVLPADRVLSVDVMTNRVTTFNRDGSLFGTRALVRGQTALSEAFQANRFSGILPDGSIVLNSAGTIRRDISPQVLRPKARVVVVSPEGVVREIVRIPDLQMGYIVSRYGAGPRRLGVPVRFSPTAHVMVWDSSIALSDAASYQIDWSGQDGDRLARLMIDLPRRAVTDEMIAAEVDRDLARYDRPMVEPARNLEEAKRQLRIRPSADSLPPFSAIHAFPGKVLWVIDAYTRSDSGWTASAFGKDGQLLGRMKISGKPLPTVLWDNRIGFATQDENGITSLKLYRILGLPPSTGMPIPQDVGEGGTG